MSTGRFELYAVDLTIRFDGYLAVEDADPGRQAYSGLATLMPA